MLLVLGKSPLRRALRARLRASEIPHRLGRPDHDDLFERAMGRPAVVYAPASSLLRGTLEPRPDPDRMRAVLRAANAPDAGVLVVVVPRAGGYDAELDVLRRSGKPYVIVAAAPLLEEVSRELSADDAKSLWVPHLGDVEIAMADKVADAVFDATRSEYQGRTESVPSARLGIPELLAHAADLSKRDIRVHAVWPPLYEVVRPVARWLSGGEPAGVALATALAQRA